MENEKLENDTQIKPKKIPFRKWSALGYDYSDVFLHMLNNFPKAGFILFYLIFVSNKQNLVSIRTSELAEIIDLNVIQTRKYLSILQEYKFIQVRRTHGMATITINPYFTKKVAGEYIEKNNTFSNGFPEIPDKYKENHRKLSIPVRQFHNKGIVFLMKDIIKIKGDDILENI